MNFSFNLNTIVLSVQKLIKFIQFCGHQIFSTCDLSIWLNISVNDTNLIWRLPISHYWNKVELTSFVHISNSSTLAQWLTIDLGNIFSVFFKHIIPKWIWIMTPKNTSPKESSSYSELELVYIELYRCNAQRVNNCD